MGGVGRGQPPTADTGCATSIRLTGEGTGVSGDPPGGVGQADGLGADRSTRLPDATIATQFRTTRRVEAWFDRPPPEPPAADAPTAGAEPPCGRRPRDRYAGQLRHFVAGRVTNVDYVGGLAKILRRAGPGDGRADGAVLRTVLGRAWFLYDDVRTRRLSGRWAVPPEGRREVARWVVFLRSDLAHEWPAGITGPQLVRLPVTGPDVRAGTAGLPARPAAPRRGDGRLGRLAVRPAGRPRSSFGPAAVAGRRRTTGGLRPCGPPHGGWPTAPRGDRAGHGCRGTPSSAIAT